jgi:hypothetical protein
MSNFIGAAFEIATYGGAIFSDTTTDDFVIRTQFPSQKVLIGANTGSNSGLALTQSNAYFNGGFVGIATSNPQFTLDVNGDINYSGAIRRNGLNIEGSQFNNYSSNVFVLDSNLGVRTSNPQFALDVSGDINLTGKFYQSGNLLATSQFSNVSSNVFLLGSNLGIKNQNPVYDLDVTGIARVSSNMIVDGEIQVGRALTMSALTIRKDVAAPANITQVSVVGLCNESTGNTNLYTTTSASTLGIKFSSFYNTELGRITNDGLLGIGLSNPTESIHTVGKVRAGNQIIGFDADTSSNPAYTWNGNSNTGMFHPTSNTVAFSTNGTERLRIDSSGNVSIGVEGTNDRLDVRNNTNFFRVAMSNASGMNGFTRVLIGGPGGNGNVTGIDFWPIVARNGGAASYIRAIDDSNNSVQLTFGVATTGSANNVAQERMKIESNGRVGIGYPGSNLSFDLQVNGTIYAAGDIIGFSDARWKYDIDRIHDALGKVGAMSGYTYRKKGEEPARVHTGVIAQEVEEVFPAAVYTDGFGYKSVAYGNMVGILIEAIKELREEVAAIKRVVGSESF